MRGWLESLGPGDAPRRWPRRSALAVATLVEIALAQLEAEGQILRGRFHAERRAGRDRMVPSPHSGAHPSPDDRPLAPRDRAGHHRASSCASCAAGSIVAPGTQLHGVDGTLQIVTPAAGLRNLRRRRGKPEVLPRRVAHYEPEFLDQLCLSGEVMWGRLSPHPAFEASRSRAACVPRASRRSPSSCAKTRGWLLADAAAVAPIALASGARSAGRARAARRVVLRRPGRAPPAAWRAKWKTGSGNWWRRAW